MSNYIQNLVLLKDPSEMDWQVSSKAGNMFLNRFTIDEDAAFELSVVQNEKYKGRENYVLCSISFLKPDFT